MSRYAKQPMSLFALTVLIVGLLFAPRAGTAAETIPAEKQAVIDELLTIGVDEGFDVAEIQLKKMMKSLSPIFSIAFENFDKKALDFVSNEIMAIVRGQQDEILRKTGEIYASKFATQELREMVAFYKTETGQKAVRLMPEITLEATQYGQQLAQGLLKAQMPAIFKDLQSQGYVPRQKKKAN